MAWNMNPYGMMNPMMMNPMMGWMGQMPGLNARNNCKYDVCLSYKHDDSKSTHLALLWFKMLTACNIKVFMDADSDEMAHCKWPEWALKEGEQNAWKVFFKEQMRNSATVVFVCNESYQASECCRWEAETANALYAANKHPAPIWNMYMPVKNIKPEIAQYKKVKGAFWGTQWDSFTDPTFGSPDAMNTIRALNEAGVPVDFMAMNGASLQGAGRAPKFWNAIWEHPHGKGAEAHLSAQRKALMNRYGLWM
mmetsp:Transcript_11790/g.19173  ORF Transcript_11790/g.19173 Transcript_11790/m.19173 type:complete len:251 (+) Transcript_11790:280-1032(+)